MNEHTSTMLGGRFTFPGTSLVVDRMGYGTMQLAGPGVWGHLRTRRAPSRSCAKLWLRV